MIELTAGQLRGIVRHAIKGLPGDEGVILRVPLASETTMTASDVMVEIAAARQVWIAPAVVAGAFLWKGRRP